jgi:hypothetical protein
LDRLALGIIHKCRGNPQIGEIVTVLRKDKLSGFQSEPASFRLVCLAQNVAASTIPFESFGNVTTGRLRNFSYVDPRRTSYMETDRPTKLLKLATMSSFDLQ